MVILIKTIDDVIRVKDYVFKAHNEINQKYDKKDYTFHLSLAREFCMAYIHLIPKAEQFEVEAAVYAHDFLEDTLYSYSNLKKECGYNIAEYAFALENEKGRTREDKANHLYYVGINEYKHAQFVKLCDRLANGTYSKTTGSRMYNRYKEEYHHFREELYDGRFIEMWEALDILFLYE